MSTCRSVMYPVMIVAVILASGSMPQAGTLLRGKTLFDTTMQIAVSAGWNLISLPVIVPDGRVSVLFPTATSRAFSYHGRYVATDTLQPLVGYWFRKSLPSAELATLN
jgi:hypothetical protein